MQDFLYTPRGERMGILAFLLVSTLLWCLPQWLPGRADAPATDFSALEADLATWNAEATTIQDATSKEQPSPKMAATPFAPNAATAELLTAAGLSRKASRAWMSYLEKGGRFRDWEAVQRFRALTNAERDKLQSLLLFPATDQQNKDNFDAPPVVVTPFDPNTVSAEKLAEFGLSERVIKTWINYRNTGARFTSPESLEKLYVLKSADRERLQPFVQIASDPIAGDLPDSERPQQYEEAANANIRIDINRATAEEWQQLRGIGPAYSRRIVNFRDKLGGFHAVDQVAQTYGLPDSTFQAIYLQLRPSPIFRPLAINSADVETLAGHPYLNWQEARAIINYRDQHGAFGSVTDLEKMYALSAETRGKIGPYLEF